jgi:hypothetical protein
VPEPLEVLVVSWFSARWVERLVGNLRHHAAGPLRFSVVDNSGGEDGDLAHLARATTDLAIVRRDAGGMTGSRAHAAGLAAAVAGSSSRHVLVTDPDVHVLLDGWDARWLAELEATGAVAAGAPYPWWKLGKVHDFPSPVFLLARAADLRELGNDWSPFAAGLGRRLAHRAGRQVVRLGLLASRERLLARPRLARVARALERRVGVCAPDTGWRLAAAARHRRRAALLFDEVTPRAAAERWRAASALAGLAAHFELFAHRGEPALVHRYSTGGYLWRTPRSADEGYWLDRTAAAEEELAAGVGRR